MATENIANSLVSVEFLPGESAPKVSSRQLAEHFGIQHRNVLRDIRSILRKIPDEWGVLNFEQAPAIDPSNGQSYPVYKLTRDAFTLLAMGYNSPRAIQWKLRYIAAFNALEAAALERVRCTALQQGVSLQSRLTPKRLALMRKAVTFRKRGFSHREIGKMLDCSHSSAQALLKDATLLWQEVPA